MGVSKLLLRHHLAAGDSLVATMAIESLHRQYPGRYLTDFDTNVPGVALHNPHITKLDRNDPDVRTIQLHYPVSDSDKRPLHFGEGFCEYLGAQLNLPLRCQVRHPMLYLSEEERRWKSAVEDHTSYRGKFWLINAGWKNDYTVKKWKRDYFQDVVDHFHGKIQFVQIGERHHNHPKLERVIDFIGRWDGDARPLIRLGWHAEGAITAESFLGHIMAAYESPCIVLASGMFPQQWFSYPTTRVLTSAPAMSCCAAVGCCWKARVLPKDAKDTNTCLLPVLDDDPRARCMDMIKPDDVIRVIESFHEGGVCRY